MKKALKWISVIVVTLLLLPVVLVGLLYLPPVQNWAVHKEAALASEKRVTRWPTLTRWYLT